MTPSKVSSYSFEQLDVSGDVERGPTDILAAAEQIREQARAEAQAAGYADGIARAEAEMKPIVDSLVRALGSATQELAASRDALVEQLTTQAGEISLLVGRQIVVGAFDFKPELVVDVIRSAMRRLAERHRLTVLVRPEDLERVTAVLDSLRQELGGIEYMEIQADRRVESGGAIVQTEYGEIDATVEAQLVNARAIVSGGLVGDSSLKGDSQPETADAV